MSQLCEHGLCKVVHSAKVTYDATDRSTENFVVCDKHYSTCSDGIY